MFLIVMLKPSLQSIHKNSRVRRVGQLDVVGCESFNKALRHPIALMALHWSGDWFKSQGSCKGTSLRASNSSLATTATREPSEYAFFH